MEQLFNLIKTNSQSGLIENPAIPDEESNDSIGFEADSVFNSFQVALANGDLKSVLNMFTDCGGTSKNNPIVSDIIQNPARSLTHKFEIEKSNAADIATTLIPSIISKMTNKTKPSNDKRVILAGLVGRVSGRVQQHPLQYAGDGRVLNRLKGLIN